jgi:hypothetical protein
LTDTVLASVTLVREPVAVLRETLAQTSSGSAGGWLFALVLFGGIALVGGIAYLSYLQKKKRRLGFATMARQLGMEYSFDDPFGLLGEPFALFSKGDGRGIENVIWGAWQGLDVHAFDYWYYDESSDGKGNRSRTYYRFDCAIVPVDAACPHLAIAHENLMTRLAGALSFHDIQFEDETFNETFNVKAAESKFASAAIDARMMQWLMAHGQPYSIEMIGNRVLVAGDRCAPTELIQVIGTAKGFVEQIPRVVFSLYPVSG